MASKILEMSSCFELHSYKCFGDAINFWDLERCIMHHVVFSRSAALPIPVRYECASGMTVAAGNHD